jgi:RNA polymerase sigma factor (sigma-70 family)
MTGAMTASASRSRSFSFPGRRRERAAGERIATLFEEHGRLVYGICRLMLRDPVEAEDAAQQTFLSAYRALLGGQEPREPSAWLGTIARNECRTRLRARRTEPLTLVREPAGEELQREVDRHDEIQALSTALAELPPQHRDAIVLREFYGLSYAEVGAALGLSGAAVESVIFRSRKRLQDLLRPARSALGVLTLPVSLRDSLAQLVPGFGGAGASAGAGAAVFAKLASAPLTAKVAAATLAIGAAGTAAGIEHARVVRHHRGHAPAPARLAVVRRAPVTAPLVVAASAVRTPAPTPVAAEHTVTGDRREAVTETHSGPGGGEAERQAVTEGSSSGPGPGGTDGGGESRSGTGSGSGESGSGDSGSGDSHSGRDGSGGDGSGDSGSGSGGSGSGDPGD